MASSGLGGIVNKAVNSIFSSPMGKKNSFIKGDKSSGTINEMVESQETTNELLAGIKESIEVLGGDSDSLFGSSSGRNSEFGFGDLAKEKVQDKIGGKIGATIGDKLGKGEWASKLFGNLENMSSSMGNMSSSMSSMGSSMGGAGGIAMLVLQVVNKIWEAARQTLHVLTDSVQKGIEQNLVNQKQYLGPISSRLQNLSNNSATAYKELSYEIRNVFTNSRYVNQQEMLKNLNSLVEQGIGYNLEDRAYLMTISDRTVKTFDLLDSSLNRMIRLQQADLSRSQLGLEGYLTKVLNTLFEDTSYLNSMYDSVTSTLIDATSQMSFEETTGYLYNVQKWLGALYSLGISDSAISTIAQGLNYLGSGNVSQLTGNDTLNTLFAMSAQRAGLSYAQLLTTGVSEDNVDKLLRSMIEYLQSIAENTSSEVLRSEYGRVFGGLSVSDLRAIQNLTSEDIVSIDKFSMNYKQAFEETTKQIEAVKERTSLASQIENMFNNMIYSVGAQIGEDEGAYKMWLYSSIAESLGDVIGSSDLLPGIFGDLFANGVGLASQLIKISDIWRVLKTGPEGSNKGLDMFKDWEYEEAMDEAMDTAKEDIAELEEEYEDTGDLGTGISLLWKKLGLSGLNFMRNMESGRIITNGVANWDVYSQIGVLDAIGFYGDRWKQGTSRMNNYSSSIALNENAFDEAQGKIESTAEQITGIDDTVQTLDNLYDSLFGEAQRTINVRVVDVDGNLVGSTTTNSYSSNFDVEQNFNLEEFLAAVNAAYKIE